MAEAILPLTLAMRSNHQGASSSARIAAPVASPRIQMSSRWRLTADSGHFSIDWQRPLVMAVVDVWDRQPQSQPI